MKPLQPVIKWSGSKRTVASQLGEFFLPANTYYEPFVGGGAMMPFAKANKGKAGDIIPELIALWNEIKVNPELVATEYEYRWNRLQTEGYQVFYEVRDMFNKTKNPFAFLFLTRTCLNGMIRYGVSDVYIVNEFAFYLPQIKKNCGDEVKIRVFPNVSQSTDKLHVLPTVTSFFIRPEDIPFYEEYVDVCEFFGTVDRNEVLYKIYL